MFDTFRRLAAASSLVFAFVIAGCGGHAALPTAPELQLEKPAPNSATIVGQVNGASAASAGVAAASNGSGIRVTVVGSSLATSTDASGRFTLTGVPSGNVALHFEGKGVDARLEISGLAAGQVIQITVSVSGSHASLDDSPDSQETDFKGHVDSVGSTSLIVDGRTVNVNASTHILDHKKNPILLSSIPVGALVEVEGTKQSDSSVLAKKIKLEDDAQDGGDEVEFKGKVDSVGTTSLLVGGRTVNVDASTRILDHDKNPILLSAIAVGAFVEVEGIQQSDGSVLAKKIKVENEHSGGDDDNDDNDDNGGDEGDGDDGGNDDGDDNSGSGLV